MKLIGFSKVFAALLIFGVLGGCSANGPKYSEYQATIASVESDKARVFFYRQDRFMSSGLDAQIKIDGREVGECANDGYFFADVAPGLLSIKADGFMSPGEHFMELQVKPGSETFVEVLVNDDYASAGVVLGTIGQASYVANNENAGPWILQQRTEVDGRRMIRERSLSKQ